MSQPTNYSASYNFTGFQAANRVDSELASVSECTGQIINNLTLIQRDDGGLANASVGFDQLKPELLNSFPLNIGTGTAVDITGGSVDGVVLGAVTPAQSQTFAPCNLVAGTAYNFAVLDNGKWVVSQNSSASSFTILKNATVPLPLNAEITLFQQGNGQLTIVAGSGVTLLYAGANARLAAKGATAVLKQIAIDSWALSGYLG